MKPARPLVIKIGETRIDRAGVEQMLRALEVSGEGTQRFEKAPDTGETLIELAGRICYESFEVGLNPNVTRIRLNPKDYFENLLRKGDGSVRSEERRVGKECRCVWGQDQWKREKEIVR